MTDCPTNGLYWTLRYEKRLCITIMLSIASVPKMMRRKKLKYHHMGIISHIVEFPGNTAVKDELMEIAICFLNRIIVISSILNYHPG